jgi:hypothetical protein
MLAQGRASATPSLRTAREFHSVGEHVLAFGLFFWSVGCPST